MIEMTPALAVILLFAIIGSVHVGLWLGKVIFSGIELFSAKKKLAKLEREVKEAELKARQIKVQAGL